MAIIQVNLEVNDEQFKQLVVGNINDLPKDKMEELLLKAVEAALLYDRQTSYSNGNILVKKEDPNNPYYSNLVPTELMKQVMKNIDTEKYFGPIAEEIATYMRDNYKDIIQNYMIESITNLLFTDNNKYDIQRAIQNAISNMNRYK